MRTWQIKTAGYLLAPFVPVAAIALTETGMEWLVPLAFFVLLPIARPLFGADRVHPEDAPLHSIAFCNLVALAPIVYLPTLLALLGKVLMMLPEASAARIVSLGLTYFTCAALSSAAAHELIHRRQRLANVAGRLLCASFAYPHYPESHRAHHAGPRALFREPTPSEGGTLYGFAFESARHEWRTVSHTRWSGARGFGFDWIACAAAFSVVCVVVAYWLAGVPGIAFYAITSFLVWFGIQGINYIQHYGLPNDGANGAPISWEHDCPLQAALTFNIPYHEQHHRQVTRPYYLLDAHIIRACLPAPYPVLFLASLVPPLHRRLMHRTLIEVLQGKATTSGSGGDTGLIRRCLPLG